MKILLTAFALLSTLALSRHGLAEDLMAEAIERMDGRLLVYHTLASDQAPFGYRVCDANGPFYGSILGMPLLVVGPYPIDQFQFLVTAIEGPPFWHFNPTLDDCFLSASRAQTLRTQLGMAKAILENY